MKNTPLRKYSNEPSIAISEANSITTSPIKGMNKNPMNSRYNLASPFKPISEYEVENQFDMNVYNSIYQNSPFLSKHIGDIFNEESTKNYSNLSNNSR